MSVHVKLQGKSCKPTPIFWTQKSPQICIDLTGCPTGDSVAPWVVGLKVRLGQVRLPMFQSQPFAGMSGQIFVGTNFRPLNFFSVKIRFLNQ